MLGIAAPAAADVSVAPTEAVQGAGANLIFKITNESPTASVTAIEVLLPPDQPIAEVYPLSVDDWAPSMVTRQLDKPVTTLHGMELTEVTSALKWIAMPDRALPPGATTELKVAAGPMPLVERLIIGVVLTNSDGTQVRYSGQPGERPALAIGLQAGQDAHNTGEQQPDVAAEPSEGRQNSYGGWILATLLLIVAISVFSLVRQRRRPITPDAGPTSTGPEPDAKASEPEEPAEEKAMVTVRSGPVP
jgi:hypothetical protein